MGQRWRTVIGIAITAVLVWWLVEKGGIDWAQAWVYIRGANPLLLVLSAAVATSIYPLRAIRWRILLDPAAPNVPIGKLWRAIAIGITATNIIGARVGEPVRAYALTREEPRVGFSTGFGSIFVDRIFDGIVILLLLVISLPRGQDTALVANSAILATVALIGALAGIYALILVPAKVIAVYHATVGRAIPRFAHHGERILTSFAPSLTFALRCTPAMWISDG